MKITLSKYCSQNKIPFSVGYQSFKQGTLGFREGYEIFVDVPDASTSKLNILQEQLISVADKMMRNNNSIMDFVFYVLENYKLSAETTERFRTEVEDNIGTKNKPVGLTEDNINATKNKIEDIKTMAYIESFDWEDLKSDYIDELIVQNNSFIIERLAKQSKLNPDQVKKIFDSNSFDFEKLFFYFAQNKFLSYEHLSVILSYAGPAQTKFIVKAFLSNNNLNEEEIKKIKLIKTPAILSTIEEYYSSKKQNPCDKIIEIEKEKRKRTLFDNNVKIYDVLNKENEAIIANYWERHLTAYEKLTHCFSKIEEYKKYKQCSNDFKKTINKLILAIELSDEPSVTYIYNEHCDYIDNLFKRINCEKFSDLSDEHAIYMNKVYDLIVIINGVIENIYFQHKTTKLENIGTSL